MSSRVLRLRYVFVAAAFFVAIQIVGIVGFMVILDEGPLDAYYRTVVLVSTVGLDTVPATTSGKALSIALVASGAVLLLYVVGLVLELTVSGIVTGARQKRALRRTVTRLEGHYLVCGYGRVGRRVASEFQAADVSYVLIDRDPAAVSDARNRGQLAFEGSATDDELLEEAGIRRARGLVACVDSDAENLYIVLTARQLNPALLIVARASGEAAGTKLVRGGADRVVTPEQIAGRELATMVLKPQVSAFLDVVSRAGGAPEFSFEQIEVGPSRAGHTIRDLHVREETGALVIAHKRPGELFNTRPDPDAVLGAGDILIGVGTPEELQALEELFGPREAVV